MRSTDRRRCKQSNATTGGAMTDVAPPLLEAPRFAAEMGAGYL